MTLIEMLVVVTIIALFAALVGPKMFGKADKARQTAAKAQINSFTTALGAYKLDTSTFPTSEMGLQALRGLGIDWAESLPTVAFAVAPNSAKILNPNYSNRLLRNFAASRDFRQDLAAARRPIAIFAGSADELLLPGKYREIVGDRVPVRIIDGINHMGIVGDPAAVSIIADDVAKSDVTS